MIDRVCQKKLVTHSTVSMSIVQLFRGGFQKLSFLVPVCSLGWQQILHNNMVISQKPQNQKTSNIEHFEPLTDHRRAENSKN